jgi:hypothetical protein
MSSIPNTSHYTPADMAEVLVSSTIQPLLDRGLRPCQIKVLDPACGEGALLIAAREYLALETVSCGFGDEEKVPYPYAQSERLGPLMSLDFARELCEGQITGGDLDEAAVARARAVLPGADLRVCDSIFEDWGDDLDYNCIVMNPPFLGGGKISGVMGSGYCKRLKEIGGEHTHGNADLAAHFLLLANRCASQCPGPSVMGVIATNTIAQGDTRETGLAHIMWDYQWELYDVAKDLQWPGRASVTVDMFVLGRCIPCKELSFMAASRLRA